MTLFSLFSNKNKDVTFIREDFSADGEQPSEGYTLSGAATRMNLAIQNDGSAFTSFWIECKTHPDGEWMTYISSTEFAAETPTVGRLLFVDSDVTGLASGSTAMIALDVSGLFALRMVVTTADPSDIEVFGSFIS